jgi:hypothetical protein
MKNIDKARIALFLFLIPVSVCYGIVGGGYRFGLLFMLPIVLSLLCTAAHKRILWYLASLIMFMVLMFYFSLSNFPFASLVSAGTCGRSSCNTNREGNIPYNAGGVMGGSGFIPQIPLCPLSDCYVAAARYIVTSSDETIYLTPNGFFQDENGQADLSRPCPVLPLSGNCDPAACDCVGSTRPQDYARNQGIGIVATSTLRIYQSQVGECWGSTGPAPVCSRCTLLWTQMGRYEKLPTPITTECNSSQVGSAECFRCVGYMDGEAWNINAMNAQFAAFVIVECALLLVPLAHYARKRCTKQKNKKENDD